MKTKSLFFSMLLAVTAFTFLQCGGNKKEETQAEQAPATEQEHASGSSAAAEAAEPLFAVDAQFQQQLAGVLKSYVTLKEALVSADASTVSPAATATLVSVENTEMKLLTGAAHNDWMNYKAGIESSLKAMVASTDIEEQRQSFSTLTDNLYKSIKAYGLGGAQAYYEFCPMAFDNQGGFWLSDVAEIRNPYFGDKMLTCGEVREKLK